MTKAARKFPHKHLISVDDLSTDDVHTILDLAKFYADNLNIKADLSNILRNKIVLTLFFEDSTRTLTSFEIAAKRLGGEVVNLDLKRSSLNKGESFHDTITTLNAMRPDAMIVRHSEYGAPKVISKLADCSVINAGDSWNEHPTQALLDAFAISNHFQKIEGLTVAIIGDIAHSRVASSNMKLLTKMGANVRIIAPPILMPEKLPSDKIEKYEDLKEGITDTDVIITIRPQKERMDKALIVDQTYFSEYGLTKAKLDWANDNTIVLDPGPFLRNVQISDDLADDTEKFHYLRQVTGGVATRMAVMDLLLNGDHS